MLKLPGTHAVRAHLNSVHRPLVLITSCLALNACGWVDSTGRQGNSAPEIVVALDAAPWDGEVIYLTESQSAQIDLTSSEDPDGSVVAYRSELIETGYLDACTAFPQLQSAAESSYNACEYGVQAEECELGVIESSALGGDGETSGQFTLVPPPLSSPLGMTYRWIVTDNDGGSSYRDMTFCLLPDGESPLALDDTYQVAYAATLTVPDISYGEECAIYTGGDSVLGNDINTGSRDSDCLQAELLSVPAGAGNDFAADFSSAGGFVYQHNGAYTGTQDSFTYRAFDGESWSEAATVTLQINTGNNKTPLATDDQFTVEGGSNNNPLYVMSNDTDPEGYALSLSEISSAPDAGGTAQILSDGYIDYTPATGFVGQEHFSYRISDAGGLSDTAQVTVTVTLPDSEPVAVDDSFVVSPGTWHELQVLDNDTDSDGDTLRIVDVSRSSGGAKLTISADADSIFFRARASRRGSETFSYTIEDSDYYQATATVTVTLSN
ncbi:Ig-like domain-containing protein [Granulosicoccaceae sp. 1_MG-2023]|nr:Ig-like domain-containing protein [Granulosicoccaceae sp. 1_MG-2023]